MTAEQTIDRFLEANNIHSGTFVYSQHSRALFHPQGLGKVVETPLSPLVDEVNREMQECGEEGKPLHVVANALQDRGYERFGRRAKAWCEAYKVA